MSGGLLYLDIGAGDGGSCGTVSVAEGTVSGTTQYASCVFRFRLFLRKGGVLTQVPFTDYHISITSGNDYLGCPGTLSDDSMTNVVSIGLPPRSSMNLTFRNKGVTASLNNVTIRMDVTNEFSVDFIDSSNH